MGCVFGLDNCPGLLTVIGTVIVGVGVFELEQGNRKRTDVRRIIETKFPKGTEIPKIPSGELPLLLAQGKTARYKVDLENINKIIEEDIEESIIT